MPDTGSHGSCVFYSEIWEGGSSSGRKEKAVPAPQGGLFFSLSAVPPQARQQCWHQLRSATQTGGKVLPGKESKSSCQGRKNQAQRWASAEGRVPGTQPSSCPTCLLPAPWRLGKYCDLVIEMKAQA